MIQTVEIASSGAGELNSYLLPKLFYQERLAQSPGVGRMLTDPLVQKF